VLRDHRNAPIRDSLKALFTLIEKVALTSHEVTAEDTEAARRAGNSDETIYDAITWADGCGVKRLTPCLCTFPNAVRGIDSTRSNRRGTLKLAS